ncbi:HD domain-containing protein [Fulvivirga kasyanovii]|uniref:HD domain-containing protein n=1 Tax=Fulvivirga kasyanovii TaxID=396812 RepID=A0ABW9RSM6_9BACT|nr:phosphonate degradation HD-domain oxygenase [Fulvivirga kasyanovii]MTI26998.1 HD domain-containing protein [Fulvivirga kasyanovii]
MIKEQEIVQEIFSLYDSKGHDEYYGEAVSQLDHMLQAATLAHNQGYDEEVVLAAFFHDVGHLLDVPESSRMSHYGVINHEHLGAEYLKAAGFSKKITALVRSHVEAKRYLTAVNPKYLMALSVASKKTLNYQGGQMSQKEVDEFEKNPLKDIILQMRKWDEQAKVTNARTLTLDVLKEMALNHLRKQH